MNRGNWAQLVGLLVLLAATLWLVQSAVGSSAGGVRYSELKTAIASGAVEEVTFDDDLVVAKVTPSADKPKGEVISAVRVEDDAELLQMLEKQSIPYSATRSAEGCGPSGLLVVFPLVLLMGLMIMMSRQGGIGGAGAQAFGRSSAQLVPEEGVGITFDDVAGVDEAAEELREVVSFLKTPERFTALGGRPPKGVLLVGPPGTGKTLLARAVAGEAGVPFFSISGSEFVEMFVGVGAARVRDLFKQATEHAPCIIFIDELDAVGKARGVGGPNSNDEREQTLNQLLVEMDGFDGNVGIILMAATNRPETLDPALLRPGRFDRQVVVDRPDLRGRLAILEVHAKKLKLHPDTDLEVIAQRTPGFAGADLANALNEAALLAARRGGTSVTLADIDNAIERIIAGLEKKNRRLSPVEKRTVAYHECGHAICAAASPGADPVTKISIIPRGIGALGYTIQMPLEDRYLMSKSELLNRITVLFGGRAAEELVFGDVTTGAGDDIRKATDLARRMVTEYGMSHKLGMVNYGGQQQSAFGFGGQSQAATSPETAEVIEVEVRGIIDSCHERAIEILRTNRALLEEMSHILLEQEVLDGDQMTNLLARAIEAGHLGEPPTGEWPRNVEPA